MALNLEHNGTIGIICIIKQIIHDSKIANILLDTDSSIGDGIYLPEINDPDYCNAYCTNLWEIVAFQRHYHITVKKLSKNITTEVELGHYTRVPVEALKLSPEDAYKQYNSSNGLFKPTTVIPRTYSQDNHFKNIYMKQTQNIYIDNVFEKCDINIFKELKRK